MYPNWHPAVVRFPIALTVTATLLLLAGHRRPAKAQLATSGRLLVTLAAASAVLAALLGWQAYQTVDHDAAGHLVMVKHRNWALATTAALLVLALWDALRQRGGKTVHTLMLPAMVLVSGGFGVTGWLGGEMVFRHGVGVSAAAFASPAATPSEPPTEAPTPTAPEAPAAAGHGEHVHKDGKRHRH
ncbi:MAG TPA: DUF2231 domain-containing protein [Azonexus sp.]